LGGLLLGLLAAGQAHAFGLIGGVTNTAVSGYAGAASDAFSMSISEKGITAIDWEELTDHPCWIRISGKDPDDASDTRTYENDICGGTSRPDSHKSVEFKDNPRYFVRGISVCTNNKSNHRMKGLKIYASKLPTGNDDVEVLTVTNSKEHANCANWHTPVYCAADKVASGVNVKVKDGSIVGIGLQCKGR
jgi:hypothetical protein